MTTTQGVGEELAQDLRDLTLQTLCKKYAGEASIHRNILMSRGTGVTGTWRDFRAFLTDIGERPSPDHGLVLINRHERTYGPGRARWMTAEEQAVHEAEFDRERAEKQREEQLLLHQAAAMKRAKDPKAASFGQWTPMQGQQVAYSDVAKKLNIPIAALSKTMADGRSADELLKRASSAGELINQDATWLPPDPKRKAGFFEAFKEFGKKPTFWTLSLGAAFVAFVGYGLISFQAPFLQRVHGVNVRDAAMLYGAPLAAVAHQCTDATGALSHWLTYEVNCTESPSRCGVVLYHLSPAFVWLVVVSVA